jgi:hypothetical protein
MRPMPVFDCGALFNALDARRRDLGLGWYELADELWQQSSDLNVQRGSDHPLCGGAVQRLRERGATSTLAMRVTQWLRQPAAAFIHPAQW